MNELNPLEERLHSWKPRLPSPRLRQHLFNRDQVAPLPLAASDALLTVLRRCLAPVSAAMLLAFVLVHQREPQFLSLSQTRGGAALAVAAFSNQFYAAYLPADLHSYLNASDARFGWTNGEAFPSSSRSLSHAGTNHLRW